MPKHSIVKAACMRTTGLLLAGALLLASPVPAPASAATSSATVTANTRVGPADSDPLRGADIPAVAADPADPRHIVMADDNFVTGNCEVRVSFDGGATWDVANLKAPDGFISPPCHTLSSGGYPHMNQSLVFGTGQNVYTVFDSPQGPQQVFGASTFGQGQGDSVLVARSTDGGRTFATAVVAIPGVPGAPFPFYIRSTIGVQARSDGDRVYVAAWGVAVTSGGPADGAGDRRLVTAASKDGGVTWSAPVDASAPGEQIREPSSPVVGPDGSVYVAWRNRDTGADPSNVIVGRSTDGGATWIRNKAGVVTGLGQGVGGGMPELAVDHASGALYLVYQETQPYGDQDIFFQRSMDAAATWSTPVRVNDDPTGNKVRQHVPRIAVAPNGRIDVVWLDHRNAYPTPVTPAPRGEADVYYASSTNGGTVFSANRRITDRTINLDMGLIGRVGSYSWYGPVLAPLGNDGVFFAWSDPRNGNVDTDTNDVFTATLHLANQPLPVQSVKASTSVALSVQLSQMVLPGGIERISNPPIGSKLVLAEEKDAADVLAGAVLARSGYGSLLVTPPDSLPKEAKDEVARLRPAGVYVIGDETSVSAKVVDQLGSAGARNIVRLAGPDQAATAASIAAAMDLRTDQDKASAKPVFGAAVVVNPATDGAAAASAFAAALRFPVLFAGKDALPAATSQALDSLNITSTIVIGDATSVGDSVLASLPKSERLGGGRAEETSMAVAAAALKRGLPTNTVLVADAARPVDAALMGAAAARIGGLLLVEPAGSTSKLEAALGRLSVLPMVDRLVVPKARPGSGAPRPLIGASIFLGLLGVGLLAAVAARRRARAAAPTG